MKLIVFGATGGTGLEVVKQGLEKGWEVTAFVRSPEKLGGETAGLSVVKGDVMDKASVASAIEGQDVVIVSLGTSDLRDKTLRTMGTRNVIAGMQVHGVERLLIVSAAGVGDSYPNLGFAAKGIMKTFLRNAIADHETQEAAVKESGLVWTVARPSGLQDGERTGSYTVSNDAPVTRIRRADVADFLINEIEEKKFVEEAITLT